MIDQQECLYQVHQLLRSTLSKQEPVRVLEAGGGSFSHIKMDKPANISVIDISPEQLSRNTYANERILGDLEVSDTVRGPYDLIVCFDVLEHLRHPDLALTHLMTALDPGGLLVIGCPNRSSTKGVVTRFTPHSFHVWYYKNIRGIPEAGEPGHAPFETFLSREMDFEIVQQQLKAAGLLVPLAGRYEGPAAFELYRKWPILFYFYHFPATFMRLFGQQFETLAATDWIIVAQKPACANVDGLT